MRSDQPLGLGDRVSINDVVDLDVHARILEPLYTQNALAVTGYD